MPSVVTQMVNINMAFRESTEIYMDTRTTDLNMVSNGSLDQGHQYSLWPQHRLWTPSGPLVAVQAMDSNMAPVCSMSHRYQHSNRTPMTDTKMNNKWNLIKLKSFCTAKDTSIIKVSVYSMGKKSLPIIHSIMVRI